MTILQAGFPKSGNYWVYRIIREGFELSGKEYKTVIRQHSLRDSAKGFLTSFPEQSEIDVLDIDTTGVNLRIGFRHRSRVTDFDAYLRNTGHVWTHSPILDGCLDVFGKFERIVYIVRDPRDIMVSMSHFAFSPYILSEDPHGEPDPATYRNHRAEDLARDWARHVLSFLANREHLPMYILFYERLKDDFRTEVKKLFDFLSISTKMGAIESIHESTALQKMKAEAPDHVRKGKAGQWSESLSASEMNVILEVASPVMRLFGYERDIDSSARPRPVGSALPQDPGDISRSAVEQASKKVRRSKAQTISYVARFLFGPRSPSQKARVLIRRFRALGEAIWKLR
jgi:aryl sulfotransferase